MKPSILPSSLVKLIDELAKLPGVGPRTAERYAYYLFKTTKDQNDRLAEVIAGLHDGVGVCKKTFALVEAGQDISPLYSDKNRDKQTIAVVEDPLDIAALEATGGYKGTYHVLGGLLSPIDGVGPEQLNISQLLDRVKEDDVQEVIIATNASVEGESTALYLQKQLKDTEAAVTRLARGLPVGVDLEYADQITLTKALEGRQQINE